jgi:hypothetical protein
MSFLKGSPKSNWNPLVEAPHRKISGKPLFGYSVAHSFDERINKNSPDLRF